MEGRQDGMSTDVKKVVFRWCIPELTGKSDAEALAYFRTHLREPDDIETDGETEVYGFEYLIGIGQVEGVSDFIQPVSADGKWGLELVLGYQRLEDDKAIGFMPEVLDGVLYTGKVHAYTWYNGVDEPITFD